MQYRVNTDQYYAGFGVRFAAYLIDSTILGLALLSVRLPYLISTLISSDHLLSIPVLFQFSSFDILIYFLSKLYYVLMLYYSGTSLGKLFFSIKVVKADGGKITFLNALYRETIGKYLSGILLLIGYLMIVVDEEKRSLHDRLCDTRVIYHLKTPLRAKNLQTPIAQPIDRYFLALTVRDDHLDEYLKDYYKPNPVISDELIKAGLSVINVLRNGNQYIYIFESGNIEYADHYLAGSTAYAEWKQRLIEMANGPITFKKAETLSANDV